MTRLSLAWLAAALLLSLSDLALAADSLFNVPVAGTLQPRRLTSYFAVGSGAGLDSEGTTALLTADYNVSRYLSAGITTRLTDGFSARPEGSVQFAPVGKPYAFAVGFASVGVRSFRTQPYAIGSTRFGDLGAYAGVTHDSYGTHPMLGVDYLLSRGFSLQGDWIHDDGSFLTVGGRYQWLRDFAIALGFSHADQERGGNGVFASLQKDFRF